MYYKDLVKILILIVSLEVAYIQGVCLIPRPTLEPVESYSDYRTNFEKHPRLDGRIVGGRRINITDAPHQVSLQTTQHICGGSIISPLWILTAAHCTQGRKARNFKVRLGSSEPSEGGQFIAVSQIIQHPKFNMSNVDYDYSLVKLAEEIKFDDTKKAVKLPKFDDEFVDGTKCYVTGWGNTETSAESREWLRSAEVPIFNQMECSKIYKRFGGVTDRMICAGYAQGGKDACQGDSGGPLVDQNGVLVGIVSWGYGCAKPEYPGVYSRVTTARLWIHDNSGI